MFGLIKSIGKSSFLIDGKNAIRTRCFHTEYDQVFSPYSRLRHKTVFITGATSGIGRACAWNFAAAGANIIITGRRQGRLEEITQEISKKFPESKVHFATMDVRNKSEIESTINSLPNDLKSVDILLNNAGLVVGLEPLEQISSEDMDTMLDTNVKGLVYCTQLFLPTLQSTNGHIVNIGSIAG
ncbi:NADP-dependent L-serine/L-allo-threonine dehydrogenase YdfG [Smittium mucronatum]|uniref:NADP-dependent L-serine/L-allo-threonine dehydrogenase YdfG n=1 Tax=Smittium mucronatum TaxID=133383 RepID=A0A1R0GYT9_9FUNG|nr:NADP-dependent L-serine/L-allo-threonine dehydrogenase YdfG [Smittium mucronatum]